MKTPACLLAITATLAFSAFTYAAPADDLAAAVKKLAAAPNYSWTTTTEMANSQFPAMPADGVAEKDGFSIVTRNFNGNSMQTVRKGTQVVTQNRDGDWMTAEDMRAQFAGGGGGNGGGRGNGGGGGRGGFGGGMFGVGANPAETVAALAGKITELKLVDGALVATATGEQAAALLAPAAGGRGGQGGRGGGNGPQYSSVTASFWLKDGALAKCSLHTIGKMTLPNGDERDLDSTTTTEFKNVGTTKVEVPDAAKKKIQ